MTSLVIDIPNLHDGSLTGLDFASDRVTARMTDWTGKPYVLEMRGVERFHVAVESNNLIGWLEIIQGKRPRKRLLRRLFGTPNPRWPDYFQSEVEDEAERADRIVSGEAALVVLHGNFTVFFVGLCESAILTDG
ncbi:hypothetical protein [Brevundimonas sp.]|uniref:hypothetical protein n=1 Tax=Brevundimonas sp. TaxID=1871086 RepID=UPI00356515FD